MSQEEHEFEFAKGSVKSAMAGCKSADLWKVPIERIKVVEGFNVRVRDEAFWERVRSTADSIKANGYYPDKPLAVFVSRDSTGDTLILVDGHTRYEALKLAISEGYAITTVPVATKPSGTSMEDITVALATGNTGHPLQPYELALVCKRLIGYGMSEEEVAKRLSKSDIYIKNLLSLVAAPRQVREMVTAGKVSATLAIQTLREHGNEAPAVLKEGLATAEAAGKDRVTGKQLRKSASETSQAPRKVPRAIVQRGVSWVVEKGLTEDERILDLLAHLAGTDTAGVRNLVDAHQRDQSAKTHPGAGDGSAEEGLTPT
jgi:ParB-like chromosome segregation protein Spo0J